MNFRELRNRLISSLWDYIGCPVILSNQVQPEAEPPFCIYTVTVPYIPDGGMGDYEIADVAEGVKISRMEMPSATFSFTFCSQNRTAENGSAVNGEDEAWAVALDKPCIRCDKHTARYRNGRTYDKEEQDIESRSSCVS